MSEATSTTFAVKAGPPRLAFLDVARAIAAIAVMVQHALEGSGIETLEKGAIATSWLNLGEVGVAIFFLVSGFVIPASMKGAPTFGIFWVRRLLRIYPLYWVIFLFSVGLAVYAGGTLPPMVRTVASHALFVQSWIGWPNFVGGSWTLLLELLWYVCFSIAFFSPIGIGLRLVMLFLLASPAVLVLSFIVHGLPLGRFCILALCFWGYTYFLYFENSISRRMFIGLSAAFVLLIYACFFVGFHLQPNDAHGAPDFRCVSISYIVALTLFPLFFFGRHMEWANSRTLAYLGEISFSVYLVHSPVMHVLAYAGISGLPFLIGTLAITIAVATLTFRYIERPGISLSRALSARLKEKHAGVALSV